MSDLVGNHKDRFSRIPADIMSVVHCEHYIKASMEGVYVPIA